MHGEESITQLVAIATLMVGGLLLVAKIGGELVSRFLRLPPVLGELMIGILIAPYALGGLEFFGVGPIFVPEHVGSSEIPVPREVYFIAQISAAILLFEAGLETNRKSFLKYFRPATLVALGGVLLPFALGFFGTIMFGFASFSGGIQGIMPALFVGAAMTATSVGITARILADMGSLDSPEGVTVLGAAVVDDVLGVLLVAILVAVNMDGTISAGSVLSILGRAVGFLVVLTLVVSLIANRLSKFVLSFRSAGAWLGIAFSLAFITGGVAEEYFGLALIIGTYSIGLALSETKLKHRIEGNVRTVSLLLSPLFFVVIGMQVDFGALFGGDNNIWLVIGFAVVLSVFGILSKLLGSGLPALLVGFNRRGAARIGVAMMPRGEVALIVAGIGIGSGVIDRTTFGFVVVMTVVTTVVAPILLPFLFRKGGSGLKKPEVIEKTEKRVGDP